MLLGEHAVVYGKPCIVTAVGQRMKATVELTDSSDFELEAPDVKVTGYKKPMADLGNGEIPKGAKFVEIAVKNFFNSHPERSEGSLDSFQNKSGDSSQARNDKKFGIRITTKSEFSSEFGFGSSSASTVCVIKALSEITGTNLDSKAIFDLSYKTVLDIQGKGSGFDVAAAVFGGTLYYVIGGKVLEPIKIDSFPLIVGYTGIKHDTVALINEVSKKAEKYPEVIENVYSQIEGLVKKAKVALQNNDFLALGELMNFNEGYLSILGVEGKKLADMIYAARETGAYGAKLSGAGIGDCMISIAPANKAQAVKEAIIAAGGQIIDVETNVEGVRIEA